MCDVNGKIFTPKVNTWNTGEGKHMNQYSKFKYWFCIQRRQCEHSHQFILKAVVRASEIRGEIKTNHCPSLNEDDRKIITIYQVNVV